MGSNRAFRTSQALFFAGFMAGRVAFGDEMVVQNDLATDASQATPCMCFIQGDEAAAWLTSPCNGQIVALQVLWDSPIGGQPDSLETALRVYDTGTFPSPGTVMNTTKGVKAEILGPILSDGVINEYRFITGLPSQNDPIAIRVSAGQEFVVSLEYLNQTSGGGPFGATTAWDLDGTCQAGKNAVFTTGGWFDACGQGVPGDWVIRAVVACRAVPAASSWGLLILALVMFSAAALGVRRARSLLQVLAA